jgi:hypothetical protein
LIVGVDLLWRVELELSAWRGSHPIKLRRLRRVLGRDAEIVRARNVSSHLLLRSAGATITVEVIADSPGAAARCISANRLPPPHGSFPRTETFLRPLELDVEDEGHGARR